MAFTRFYFLCRALIIAVFFSPLTFANGFDMPSGPLASALLALAQQWNVQIIFRSDVVEHKYIDSIKSANNLEQMLQQVLLKTGLSYRLLSPGTYIIEPIPIATVKSAAIEEKWVIGTYIRESDRSMSIQSVRHIDRVQWQTAAPPDATALLQGLNQAGGSDGWVDNLSQPFVTGTADLNLRNLGVSSALVLVDGKRQAAASVVTVEGATFVDINMLPPLEAIERVDMLMDGASATYGSDAVAGVVNLIPRTDLDGTELSLHYTDKSGSNYGSTRLSWLQGSQTNNVRWLSALVLNKTSALPAAERKFTRGTAWSNGGQPGTFLTSKGWVRDPACGVNGSRSVQGSPFCQLDISSYYDVSPEEKREQWFGSLSGDFNAWQINVEGMVAHASVTVSSSPSYPFVIALPVVPVDNPGNTFGEPVQFYGRVLGAGADAATSTAKYLYGFSSLQAQRDLGDHHLNVTISASQHGTHYSRRDALIDRVQQALDGHAGPQQNMYWNPLYGAPNQAGMADSFLSDWKLRGLSDLGTFDTVLDSNWFDVGIGEAAYALGGHARFEHFSQHFAQEYNEGRFLSLGGGQDFGGSQAVAGLFGEMRWDWNQKLSTQLSVRHEQYSGGQHDTVPKLGVRWAFSSNLSLHANIGNAFRAASVFQAVAFHSVPEALVDPASKNQLPTYCIVQTQGNKQLKSETATVTALGISWLDNTKEWSLDAWSYDYRDLILKESPQALVNRAAAGDIDAQARIERNPATGELLLVHTNFVNTANARTQGFDGHLETDLPWQWRGRWRLGGDTTFVQRFDLREARDEPWRSVVNLRNANDPLAHPIPRWRGHLYLDWSRDRHRIQLSTNYIGSYRDDANNNHRIDDFKLWDVDYRLQLPWSESMLEWSIGIHNIFDRNPPHIDNFLGYDTKLHDPRGRLLQSAINWRF